MARKHGGKVLFVREGPLFSDTETEELRREKGAMSAGVSPLSPKR